jgi:hypothetical protein
VHRAVLATRPSTPASASSSSRTTSPTVTRRSRPSKSSSTRATFNGANTYRLHVLPNPPVTQFWSVTLYDVSTRTLIDNKTEITDRSSPQDIAKNADGSVDLYFGPSAPKGLEKNWIPTLAGKAWFPYFRLYGPTEAHFDGSWKLPNIERVK